MATAAKAVASRLKVSHLDITESYGGREQFSQEAVRGSNVPEDPTLPRTPVTNLAKGFGDPEQGAGPAPASGI